jgi:hypothetical protein
VSAEHPSFFALDRMRLGLGPRPEERAHLAACATCAAYVRRPAPDGPLPAWTDAAPVPPRRRRLPRAVWPGLAVVAVAAVLLIVRARPERPDGGIREKGGPSVAVFVKRGEAVDLWDGRAAIRPGDRLRLQVRAPGYAFVSVASLSVQPPIVLYAGPLGARPTLLPAAFRVDGDGRQESLSVVLSHTPAPASAHDGTAEPPAGPAMWRQILVLAKEMPDASPERTAPP